MAMFTDIQFDEASGRHELHFVNQQYDYLMCIRWDAGKNDYAFSVSEATARKIAGVERGGGFDPEEYLRQARVELPEADRRPRS